MLPCYAKSWPFDLHKLTSISMVLYATLLAFLSQVLNRDTHRLAHDMYLRGGKREFPLTRSLIDDSQCQWQLLLVLIFLRNTRDWVNLLDLLDHCLALLSPRDLHRVPLVTKRGHFTIRRAVTVFFFSKNCRPCEKHLLCLQFYNSDPTQHDSAMVSSCSWDTQISFRLTHLEPVLWWL